MICLIVKHVYTVWNDGYKKLKNQNLRNLSKISKQNFRSIFYQMTNESNNLTTKLINIGNVQNHKIMFSGKMNKA